MDQSAGDKVLIYCVQVIVTYMHPGDCPMLPLHDLFACMARGRKPRYVRFDHSITLLIFCSFQRSYWLVALYKSHLLVLMH